jgi:hypothetical protein
MPDQKFTSEKVLWNSRQEIHRILGILSVNSFVVHDGGSDEANTDLGPML